jgi:hypothetical protein
MTSKITLFPEFDDFTENGLHVLDELGFAKKIKNYKLIEIDESNPKKNIIEKCVKNNLERVNIDTETEIVWLNVEENKLYTKSSYIIEYDEFEEIKTEKEKLDTSVLEENEILDENESKILDEKTVMNKTKIYTVKNTNNLHVCSKTHGILIEDIEFKLKTKIKKKPKTKKVLVKQIKMENITKTITDTVLEFDETNNKYISKEIQKEIQVTQPVTNEIPIYDENNNFISYKQQDVYETKEKELQVLDGNGAIMIECHDENGKPILELDKENQTEEIKFLNENKQEINYEDYDTNKNHFIIMKVEINKFTDDTKIKCNEISDKIQII